MDMPIAKPLKVKEIDNATFSEYKDRLACTLLKHNFHADEIASRPEFKQQIEDYVIDNVINATNRNAIMGISKKLANMDVKLPDGECVSFPIIHTYKYHNLVSSTIFYIDKHGDFIAEDIELIDPKLIIV